MKKVILLSLMVLGGVAGAMAQTVLKVDLSIFPKPEEGFKQVVIEVPHSSNDHNKKIEFSAGKWMEVDVCNTHRLGGTISQKDLSGWGYNYYVVESKGEVASTMMACMDNTLVNKFITMQPELVRYNGRMPIVIYVPEDFEVTFKIYSTDGEEYQASEIRQKNK